jgi:hypothetical protein
MSDDGRAVAPPSPIVSSGAGNHHPTTRAKTSTLTLRGGVHAGVDGADATRITLAEILARLG